MLSAYSLGLMAAFTTVGVTAQNYASTTSSEATPTPTKTDAVTTHTINVGRDAHVFTPQETVASVGDIIKFNFFPGGHGVARAGFLNPCIPYEYANDKPGFWSGFFHPQAILNPPPSYEVQVNDTEPIFFYCAAPNSCTDWQMIGVINPNSTQTFKAQFAEAQKAQFQLVPGEPWPTESARPKPTQNSASGAGNNSDNQSGGGGGGGLSPGAIAGIAIGGVAVLVLAAALLYLCGRRGGFDKAYRKSALPVANVPAQPQMAEGGFPVSANPKSPGQSTVATFAAHDPYQGSPFFAQGPSPAGYHPVSPGLQPGYLSHQHTGYSDVNSHAYQASHTSPQAPYQMAFEAPAMAPAPVELPSSDVPPNPARSPPPQYSQTSKP